jgi:antimicrobial peptide system SdpB family protein
MLTRLGERLRAWASARRPHTNVYGLARTLLALGTLGTLLFTDTYDLFRPAVGIPTYPNCPGIARGSLFCLAGREKLEAAHWIAVAALLVVASGWRPRLTGVLHWYVAGSLFASGLMVDGGDQVTAVLTLLLVPVTLTDGRRWHWEAPAGPARGADGLLPTAAAAAQLVALSSLLMIRVQMAGIYLQAAVSKTKVAEWRDGTAIYYWFTDPWFGLADPVKGWAMPLLATGVVVAAATWGAIMLEIFLFAGLIAERPYRRVLLRLGIAFHAAIALVHGLLSFVLGMWAGLVLYLRPVDEEFAGLRAWGGRMVEAARARLPLRPAPVPAPAPGAAVAAAMRDA